MVAIGVQRVHMEKALADERESCDDVVAVEEPLEIRVLVDGEEGLGRAISVTMRTTGNDTELAIGFLHGEGLLRDWRSVRRVRPAGPSGNVLLVELQPGVDLDLARLQRNFYTTSSCGVCGQSSLEALDVSGYATVEKDDHDALLRLGTPGAAQDPSPRNGTDRAHG